MAQMCWLIWIYTGGTCEERVNAPPAFEQEKYSHIFIVYEFT
jgi:hypothetical protein